jgi:integrase
LATLIARKSKRNGKILYTVQAQVGDERRCIPIGMMNKAMAVQIKGFIETLIAARRAGMICTDGKVCDWLNDVGDDLHTKLCELDLCQPRVARVNEVAPTILTLGEFIDGYIERRSDVKDATVVWYQATRRCLVEFFGEDRPLDSITAGEANDFRRWLTKPKNEKIPKSGGQGLNENTCRKRCSIAKHMFQDAVDRELIDRSPFQKIKGLAVGASDGRSHFVTRDDAAAVLKACPDNEWRAIFSLARFGGLRTPSEVLELTWGDVKWDRGRVVVRSPKTAHHGDGHAEREMPLFPELRRDLRAALDDLLASDFDPKRNPVSQQYVIRRYRDRNCNLRTQLIRIIKAAGLEPWPKLFVNLRASRATELAAEFPGHVAAAWLGHSNAIANRHYRQVTDADYDRASCAANAVQQSEETGGMEKQQDTPPLNIPAEIDDSRGLTGESSAPCWTRTNNLLIKSQLLCQLS